jgi:hypothetical protein
MLLGHCCLVALPFPSAPATSEAASLLAEFATIALLDAQHERLVVTMLLGENQSDALALMHPWLRAVGVRPPNFRPGFNKSFLHSF